MNNKILLAYATRYGSTQDVAESIAEILREGGFDVDVQPMQSVRTLDGYGAVILGAPLYVGKWPKHAHRFLSRFEETIVKLPVAIFALGPIHDDEDEILGSRVQLDTELKKYPWLKPVEIEMFVGRYDPSKFNFFDRLIASMPASPIYKMPASDHRDWVAIHIWAGKLVSTLQPVPTR